MTDTTSTRPQMAKRSARKRPVEEMLRSLAVTLVDGRHGYTMEFSQNPEGHRQEYNDMESYLRTALDMNKITLTEVIP